MRETDLIIVPMTLAEFDATIAAGTPPKVAPLLVAMWHEARGDWTRAHSIAQDIDDAEAALVHAYLHRKEGDVGNAAYWYRRAGRSVADDSLANEWRRIVTELLSLQT